MLPRARPRSSCKSVRIYKGLLLLSLLEGILWSLCLFHSASASGLAYYQRETVRRRAAAGACIARNPQHSACSRADARRARRR